MAEDPRTCQLWHSASVRNNRLMALEHTPAEVSAKAGAIYDAVLERSEHIRIANFEVFGATDLRLLFDLYDNAFFDDLLGTMIRADNVPIQFRLSNRMTRVAGTTTALWRRDRAKARSKVVAGYEIAISTILLFGTFLHQERTVTVGGLVCRDRLEALQRVFEHELLHLAEFLGWGRSSCSGANFRLLALRVFGHAAAHHDLVTPREQAARLHGIRVGDRVQFEHEGEARVGVVNRITKRATVLVEQAGGIPYSDGKTYATYYVPIPWLQRQEGEPG